MNSIFLAYAGVHQIFQLTLAAHEIDELAGLTCSLVDLPGKWGARISRWLRFPSARPLGLEQIPMEKIHECPLPLLLHRLGRKLLPWRFSEHYHTNILFDRHVAAQLQQSDCSIFVCGETCSLRSLQVAKARGITCVMDCAGIPSAFLDQFARRAAEDFQLPVQATRNSPRMAAQKARELELADVVLAVSDLQKIALVSQGVPPEKIRVIPLWVDHAFWSEGSERRVWQGKEMPLRVLYAGTLSLSKGVPYLLRALQPLREWATLTMAGSVSPELQPMLQQLPDQVRLSGRLNRDQLRDCYREHDVLVMPTLGDSFGFVTLEAMAAGLPVIVSENAGAPVPDASWRVPVCDAAAITRRLRHYIENRETLRSDVARAQAFAAEFDPARYRHAAGGLLRELMAARGCPQPPLAA